MSKNRKLDSVEITATIEQLKNRIGDRFPSSSLKVVTNDLISISEQTFKNIEYLKKPNLKIRLFSSLIIFLGSMCILYPLTHLNIKMIPKDSIDFVSISNAAFQFFVFLFAGFIYVTSIESKRKRKKALKLLNELRTILHVIDMHQLTKDPYLISKNKNTVNSPNREYDKFELERYLNYCSEISSLTSKIAALYAQNIQDEIIIDAVNDIEMLASSHSRKIWQKIYIITSSEECNQ